MFDQLADAVASADASAPPEDTELRLHRALRALRGWAITHPTEFSVMFGPRTRIEPESDITPAVAAGSRFGSTFFALLEQLLREKDIPLPAEEEIDPELRGKSNSFADTVGASVHEVSVGAAPVLTRCWARVYGVVCVEVFQHLDFVVRDMEPLFESELQNMMTGFGTRYRPVEHGEGSPATDMTD